MKNSRKKKTAAFKRLLLKIIGRHFGAWGPCSLMGSTSSFVRKLRKERKA